MTRVLLTAFGPYDTHPDNASWLALMELTRELGEFTSVTTRRYPVDFVETRERLKQDLSTDYDVILHLGQAVGATAIQLEQIALNVGRDRDMPLEETFELESDGPLAYRSTLPLATWTQQIRATGIPCQLSHHAGTYLCNAIFYWTSHQIALNGWDSQVAFIHLPLSPQQSVAAAGDQPTLPTSLASDALQIILQQLRESS